MRAAAPELTITDLHELRQTSTSLGLRTLRRLDYGNDIR